MLPPIEEVNNLLLEEVEILVSQLFEPTKALSSIVFDCTRSSSFINYDELIEFVRNQLKILLKSAEHDEDDRARLYEILGAHPRLGAAKVESESSKAEQAQLNKGGEGAKLAELNEEYEEKFPGMIFVCFVNGRGRDEIMQDMKERIERNDIAKEKAETVDALCDIAKDRAKKLQ